MSKKDLVVVYRNPSSLRADPRNARTHSEAQVDQLRASIREFGFTNPILLRDDDRIGAGHGRWLAARLEGLDRIPTITLRGLSAKQWRAYAIADNQLALNAGWDDELLRKEIAALAGEEFDLSLIGFPEDALRTLLMEVADGENDPLAEWRGMPGFQQGDKTAFRSLALHFKDQEAVDRFAALVGRPITEKTRFLWFPEVEIERYADKQYAAEDDSALSDLHPVEGALG